MFCTNTLMVHLFYIKWVLWISNLKSIQFMISVWLTSYLTEIYTWDFLQVTSIHLLFFVLCRIKYTVLTQYIFFIDTK